MKKRLKIGIFMDSYYPAIDGVVLVIDNLAKELAKFNDVTVVVPKSESIKDDINRPYKVIRIDSIKVPTTEYRLGLPKNKLSKMFRELVNEEFDVIHILQREEDVKHFKNDTNFCIIYIIYDKIYIIFLKK